MGDESPNAQDPLFMEESSINTYGCISEAGDFGQGYIKLTHLGKFLNAFRKHVLVIMVDNFKKKDLRILVACSNMKK